MKTLKVVCVAALFFLVAIFMAAYAGGMAVDLKAPNGLNFLQIQGFENWGIITGHIRTDKNEIRLIVGNDICLASYREGAGLAGKKFREGSIIVKTGYTLKPDKNFTASLEPALLQRVEYMVKDRRFAGTGGWGYARFVYNPEKRTFTPYGKDAGFAKECGDCHSRVKGRDFVFTASVYADSGQGAADIKKDEIKLGAKGGARGVPLWAVHAFFMIAGAICIAAGIIIGNRRRQNWLPAHRIAGLAGVALNISGFITAVYMVSVRTGAHFHSPHTYFGLAASLIALITPVIAVIMLGLKKENLRKLHRISGRSALGLIALALASGLFIMFRFLI